MQEKQITKTDISKEKCTICGRSMSDGVTMIFSKDKETRCNLHERSIPVESETTNYLYSEVNNLEGKLKDLLQIVIEDVPHQYQERLLKILTSDGIYKGFEKAVLQTKERVEVIGNIYENPELLTFPDSIPQKSGYILKNPNNGSGELYFGK